jgi:hypothetical protein
MTAAVMETGNYTVWSLWQCTVGVPPVVVHQHKHRVSREVAREYAAFLNKHYGREAGCSGRYLAGLVDKPPPIEAFE